MNIIKKNILELDDYSVTQDLDCIKLNQNESPEDISAVLKSEVLQKLEATGWNRYPGGAAQSLRKKIADYSDFPVEGIVVGNGSNELIQTLIYALCDTGDRIVTVQPGFSIYKRIASIMNIATFEVPLQNDFSFDVDALIEAGKNARVMFLASPNNPTGTSLCKDEIKRIAENFRGILAVDEAYYEFSRETAQLLIKELDNFVILRTFSKALGLAGLRLGYLLGNKKMIKLLSKARLPFSVGIFQQLAGEAVLNRSDLVIKGADKVIRERERVFRELEKIPGIDPIPSQANFILFSCRQLSSHEVFSAMYEAGVLIRHFGSARLENILRVTIGTYEENKVFLHELNQVMSRRVK